MMTSKTRDLPSFLSLPSSLTPLCAGPQTCQVHCCLRAFALTVPSAWNMAPHLSEWFILSPSLAFCLKNHDFLPHLTGLCCVICLHSTFPLHQVLHLQFDLLPTYLPSLECKPHEDRGFVIACHVFRAGTLWSIVDCFINVSKLCSSHWELSSQLCLLLLL